MIEALNKKGYNAYSISVPSPDELLTVLGLAAPVFITMISKVTLYSITQFCSCIWSHVIISLCLRYFDFLGGFLLPPYIFCYIYGHIHHGRSSG